MIRKVFAAVVGMLVSAFCAPMVAQDKLDQKLAEIVPTGRSEAFRQIPWHTDLILAVKESKRTKRPLFMWVMDGHPLGCT